MTKKENNAKRTTTKGFAEIELVPDAWPRFEKFIRDLAKAGPQHRTPTAKPKAKARQNDKPLKKRGRLKKKPRQ